MKAWRYDGLANILFALLSLLSNGSNRRNKIISTSENTAR